MPALARNTKAASHPASPNQPMAAQATANTTANQEYVINRIRKTPSHALNLV
jgi:hypothetical protein